MQVAEVSAHTTPPPPVSYAYVDIGVSAPN